MSCFASEYKMAEIQIDLKQGCNMLWDFEKLTNSLVRHKTDFNPQRVNQLWKTKKTIFISC